MDTRRIAAIVLIVVGAVLLLPLGKSRA